MDPKIHEFYTEDILAEVCSRFEIDANTLEELDGFESYIYSFEKEGKGYVLRVGHSSHRDPNAVQGEAEFIDYLGANGIHVGRPVRDANGNLVEAIPVKEGEFVAVAFEKVPGEETSSEDWKDGTLMHKLGCLVGRMHALARDFQPSEERFRRLDWEDDNEIMMGIIQQGLSVEEAALVSAQFQELVEKVRELPKDRSHYGLIHFDVHGGNFFLHHGEIYLFDFDDCMYSWFANDIAMVFYYGLMGFHDDPAILTFLSKQFISGYNEFSYFDPLWLDYISAFITLRNLDLYARVHHDIPEAEWDWWCQRLVNGARERRVSGAPLLGVDFSTLLD
jgi:Ser/Thr protein kinase RdoA (MazF antagonist)